MKILYVYDVEGWAIQSVGLAIKERAHAFGYELILAHTDRAEDFARTYRPDVIHIGYSTQYRNLNLSALSGPWALTTTVHDPIEVSPFTNTLGWKNLPMYRSKLSGFDRISCISEEMLEVLRKRYGINDVYLTPTFPDSPELFRAGSDPLLRGGCAASLPLAVISTTNVVGLRSRRSIARRIASSKTIDLIMDEKGRLNPKLIQGLFVRTNRKNLPLLQRVKEYFLTDPRIDFDLRTGPRILESREEYSKWLGHGDVYLCLSNMEGGPLPVMEAVLSGLAVVTTPVGQVDSWVTDRENGFIVHDFGEAVEALMTYLESPGVLRDHQRASLAKANKVGFDPVPWFEFWKGEPVAHAGP